MPKLSASVSEIHSAPPPLTAIASTPMAASATAAPCTGDTRSRSTTMPSATLMSGLMK